MYLELAAYLLILAVSLAYACFSHANSWRSIHLFVIALCLVALILVIRQAYDVDIKTYAEAMTRVRNTVYYLREPVVWQGQAYLYRIVGSSFIVFVVFDLLTAALTLRALQRFKLPVYAFLSIFIFFPYILGMQNVYRQWVAMAFLLTSFSYIYTNGEKFRLKPSLKPMLAWALAVLSHNAVALFLPVLFIRWRSYTEIFFFVIALVISVLGLIYGAETKSSAQTGVNLVWAYFGVFCLFGILLMLAKQKKIDSKTQLVLRVIVLMGVLNLGSAMTLSPAGSERIAMIGLLLLFPLIALTIESIKDTRDRVLMRAIFITAGFAVLLVFPARMFLLSF